MINNVILEGRLTKDPDMDISPRGKTVLNFQLAVPRSYTNENGERESDFFYCTLWGKQAVTLAEHGKSGALISVEAKLKSSSYKDKNNVTQYSTTVDCKYFHFLESMDTMKNRNKDKNDVTPVTTNETEEEPKIDELHFPFK